MSASKKKNILSKNPYDEYSSAGGTYKPRLNGETTGYEPPTKKQQWGGMVVTILVVALIAIFFRNNRSSKSIDFYPTDDYLVVTGPTDTDFKLIIPWLDIASVETVDRLDLGETVKVFLSEEDDSCVMGVNHNDEYGDFNICISKRIPRFIVLRTATDVYVFNYNNASDTSGLREGILNYLDDYVYNK